MPAKGTRKRVCIYGHDTQETGRESNGSCTVCVKQKRAIHGSKEYQRAKHLKKKYGLTLEQHAAIIELNRGLCPICLTKPKRWHVDHDHSTGQVRGIICQTCNMGLGSFKDNTHSMQRAIDYLKAA